MQKLSVLFTYTAKKWFESHGMAAIIRSGVLLIVS